MPFAWSKITKKDKICLMLCGQARYYERGYQSIKENILDVYRPDVYIHTWNHPTEIVKSAPWNRETLRITRACVDEYIKMYSPTKYKIQEELTHTEIDNVLGEQTYSRTSSPDTKYNFYSYLFSLKECYNLIETPEIYDAFIILRSDTEIYKFPKPSITHINLWDRLYPRDNVIDMFWCSIPKNYIEKYTSLKDELNNYYQKGYDYNYEEMFYAHLKETGLLAISNRFQRVEFEVGIHRTNKIERL